MENTLFGYVAEFTVSLLTIVATILPIMNPPGGAAMFLSATEGASPSTRHALSKSIAKYAFVMLLCFMLLGSLVLKFFGISTEIVMIAGGLVVVKFGWELLNAKDTFLPNDGAPLPDAHNSEAVFQTAFYPLTFPLTIGPGVLAACLAVSIGFTKRQDLLSAQGAVSLLGAFVGIVILALVVRFCYGYAEKVLTMLGENGATIFLRICAFILLCIGIQLIWKGVSRSIVDLYYSVHTTESSTPSDLMMNDSEGLLHLILQRTRERESAAEIQKPQEDLDKNPDTPLKEEAQATP